MILNFGKIAIKMGKNYYYQWKNEKTYFNIRIFYRGDLKFKEQLMLKSFVKCLFKIHLYFIM